MIRLRCEKCGKAVPALEEFVVTCCDQPMVRAPLVSRPTVRETIDNGLLARRVETFAEVERLHEERISPLVVK